MPGTTRDDAGVVPAGRDGRLPMSWQQEGLWFLQLLNPAAATLHLPMAMRLRGELEPAALRESLRLLVARHEGLRTRFEQVAGVGYQVIDPAPAGVQLPVVELPVAGWQGLVAEEVRRPFVLEEQWPLRWWLGRLAERDHVLVVTVHHIAADGRSVAILARELRECYAAVRSGRQPELEPAVLSVQSADYAVWQRRHGEQRLAAGLEYWQRQLTGLVELEFPADRARPVQPSGAGAGFTGLIPAEVGAGLGELATELRVPLLSVLLAGLLVVLHRYTGQQDLAVGSVSSGRGRAELEPMLGCFVNPVVLRTSVAGDPSFTELVGRCRDTVLGALEHQDVPFTAVVDALHPERIPGRNPLFQISLTLSAEGPAEPDTPDLAGLAVERIDLPSAGTWHDLSVNVSPRADGSLAVSVEYSVELFDADRIQRLVKHWQTAF
ncbi:MAG TPA: condensation domain-containing protein, partial [Jatrophihabitans sp.]|nr:condensation domain-containing protein [Jatrophihabitans sp.]